MQAPYDIGLVIRAVEFAAQKHRMQRRKDEDASPYINHPIALMHVLCRYYRTHDHRGGSAAPIEDTETAREEAGGYWWLAEMVDHDPKIGHEASKCRHNRSH